MPHSQSSATDPLKQFPGYLTRRASIAVMARLNDELANFSLRHTEFSLLQLIGANPGIKQSEACRLLEIKRANMVPLVAGLEQRGLIARKPIDGRSQGISLTRSGRTLAKKAIAVVTEFEQGLIDSIPKNLQKHVEPILLAIWAGCVVENAVEAL